MKDNFMKNILFFIIIVLICVSCNYPFVDISKINLITSARITIKEVDKSGNLNDFDLNKIKSIKSDGNDLYFKIVNNELILTSIELKKDLNKEIKLYLDDSKVLVVNLNLSKSSIIQKLKEEQYEIILIRNLETNDLISLQVQNKNLSEDELINYKKLSSIVIQINRPMIYTKKILKAWIDYHPIPVQTISITDNGDLLLDALIYKTYAKDYSRLRFIVDYGNTYLLTNVILNKKIDLPLKTTLSSNEIISPTFSKPTRAFLPYSDLIVQDNEYFTDLTYSPPHTEPAPPEVKPSPSTSIEVKTVFNLYILEEWDSVVKRVNLSTKDITKITIDDQEINDLELKDNKIYLKFIPDNKKIIKLYIKNFPIIVIRPITPNNLNEILQNKTNLIYEVNLIKDINSNKLVSVDLINLSDISINYKTIALNHIKIPFKKLEIYNKPIKRAWIDNTRIPIQNVKVNENGDIWLNCYYVNKLIKQDSKLYLLIETEFSKFKLYTIKFLRNIPLNMYFSDNILQSFYLEDPIELKLSQDFITYNEFSTNEYYEPK